MKVLSLCKAPRHHLSNGGGWWFPSLSIARGWLEAGVRWLPQCFFLARLPLSWILASESKLLVGFLKCLSSLIFLGCCFLQFQIWDIWDKNRQTKTLRDLTTVSFLRTQASWLVWLPITFQSPLLFITYVKCPEFSAALTGRNRERYFYSIFFKSKGQTHRILTDVKLLLSIWSLCIFPEKSKPNSLNKFSKNSFYSNL